MTIGLTRPAPGIALITIGNPDRLGALTPGMADDLREAWRAIGRTPSLRAVVITGTGRGFCTGMDVTAAAGRGGPSQDYDTDDLSAVMGYGGPDNDVWLPCVAAVNGVCAGAGLHFLAHADIVLASSDATFLDPHVTVGQVAGLEPVSLLARMNLGALLRMTVLGRHERLTAAQAQEAGLVGEVVAPDRLLPRALELASLAARNSPAAIEASKRAIYAAVERTEALQHAWRLVRDHWKHPDYSEGMRAFAERREPDWAEPTLGKA